MKENFINSLIGQNAASNVIFGKKKLDAQPTITANPSAVSPIASDTSKIAQFSQGLSQRTNSPAKDAYVKSQMDTVTPATPIQPTETLGSLQNPQGAMFDRNTGKPLNQPETPAQPTPATPNIPTPETPKVPSKYEDAMTRYIESLTQTPEEKALRADIAKRSGQSAIDYEKALQSGETMGFASGEASRVERQNQLGIGAQTGALTALTAGREGDVAANKARVDYLASLESTPKQQLELKKAQAELDKTLAETKQIGVQKPMTAYEQAKFNQDAAQFGKEYALKVREADAKAAEKAPTTPATQTQSIERALQAANDAEKFAGASGQANPLTKAWRWATGSENFTDLQAQANTLRTLVMTLQTDPNTKKFFGPAMSNADVQFLMSGGTTLNPELQSPTELKAEIGRIKNALNTMKQTGASAPASNTQSSAPSQVMYGGAMYNVDANGEMSPA